MNKKNKFNIFKILLTVFLLVPIIFVCTACSINFGNQNASISISDDGYWVINGTKTSTKAEGKDGKDAEQYTIKDAYNDLKNEGYEGTFSDFLKEHFDVTIDLTQIIANDCKSSVVSIIVNSSRNGSGVIVETDDEFVYILTNEHVSGSSNSGIINVYHCDDRQKENPTTASVVSTNTTYDLSLIKITKNEIFENAKVANIAENNAIVGTTCIAIGNTHSKGISVTMGCVSVEKESVPYIEGGQKYQVLRHCAYIEKGSSGGGLFDLNGNLIGITNAGESGDLTLMNYAIPVEVISQFLSGIINN